MKRSVEMIAALLGVWKAGGTYVPLHTSLPADRIQYMLEDAAVQVVVTNAATGLPDQYSGFVLDLNKEDFFQRMPSELNERIPSSTLAYVIYTSGSTGTPKGVMVSHLSLMNFLCSMRERPGLHKDDILMAVTAISFDIATLELFLPLITGATVVIASDEMLSNPSLLAEAIGQYQVSIMQATPATWQLLLDSGWTGKLTLKALCGGDFLTNKLADQLLVRTGSLWNMYGPTETTVWSSINLIEAGNEPIGIGRPIGNTRLYILDQYQQPVPPGVVGELLIGGQGLALGYLNQPDLTKEKFIPDPFNSSPGGRLYRTGDLARFLSDGTIELVGRMDDQLKINGNRIELGEIISVLEQHPAVIQSALTVRTTDQGNKILIAYFTSMNDNPPETIDLKDFLRKKLPSYMIPTFFIHLESMPLTANGKINRKALPLPEDIRIVSGFVAPRNEEEQILAEIWQETLSVEQVGVQDNFFDLGGASIQILQIIAKANMYGYRIRVEHLFEFQTIEGLAAFIREELQ
jgi:amino acid adenylation domain-containing protein